MNTAADELRINAIRFLAVDAVQQGGTWKIDNIDTFSAGS